MSSVIKSLIGVISGILVFSFILGALFFFVFGTIAASIVPLTWIFGLVTNQSYNRVCDNSEILFKINQVGKWTLIIYLSLLLIYIFFKLIF